MLNISEILKKSASSTRSLALSSRVNGITNETGSALSAMQRILHLQMSQIYEPFRHYKTDHRGGGGVIFPQ